MDRRELLAGVATTAAMLPEFRARPAFAASPGRMPTGAAMKPIVDSVFASQVAPKGEAVGIIVGVTSRAADGAMQRAYFSYGSVPVVQPGTTPVAPKDIVMFIGSNTKIFTGTMLALAAIRQKLPATGIRTPVAALLPKGVQIAAFDNEPIELWHLATHSAGFPGYACGPRTPLGDYPFKSLAGFLEIFKPPYAPGRYWVYSNVGFGLVGALIAHVNEGGGNAGWEPGYLQWPAQVGPLVTAPLGMAHTQVAYQPVLAQVARGYGVGPGQAPTAARLPSWDLDSVGLAAGVLSSTAEDMLMFLEAQIAPPATPLGQAIALTQAPNPGAMRVMGLGWQIGNGYLDKTGAYGGHTSYMGFDPSSAIGVIVLCNSTGTEAAANGGRALLGKLRGQAADPFDPPNPPKPPVCP